MSNECVDTEHITPLRLHRISHLATNWCVGGYFLKKMKMAKPDIFSQLNSCCIIVSLIV